MKGWDFYLINVQDKVYLELKRRIRLPSSRSAGFPCMRTDDKHLVPVQIVTIYPYPDVNPPETFLVFLKGREDKVVPISIGDFEGKALTMAIRQIPHPRPLPHHLLQSLLEKIKGEVHQLVIHTLKDDVFHAYLLVQTQDDVFYLDCRPSDGMVVATLMGVPIYMSPEVIDEAGKEFGGLFERGEVVAEDNSDMEASLGMTMEKEQLPLGLKSEELVPVPEDPEIEDRSLLEELKAELVRLVAEEYYEKAAELRDRISELEKKNK